MKWWEKTVEYYFVCNFMKLGYFAMPLDGSHEVIGDAIFADNNLQFFLIEFKKDSSAISSERKKFTDYEEFINCIYEKMYIYEKNDFLTGFQDYSQIIQKLLHNANYEQKIEELAKWARYHLIIFGEIENNALSLKYISYYNPKREQCHGDMFYCGTKDIEQFKYYIENLLICKFPPNGPSGPSTAKNFLNYTYIFGISKSKKQIIFISLYDYLYGDSDKGASASNFLYI